MPSAYSRSWIGYLTIVLQVVDGLAYGTAACLAVAFMIWWMGFFLRKIQDVPLGPLDWRLTGEAHRDAEQRGIEAQHRLADRLLRLRPLAVVLIVIAIGLFAAAMLIAN